MRIMGLLARAQSLPECFENGPGGPSLRAHDNVLSPSGCGVFFAPRFLFLSAGAFAE
jgi:hypothetical protein